MHEMIIHLKDDIIYERLSLPVNLYNTRGSRCSFHITTPLRHHHPKPGFDSLLRGRIFIIHNVSGGGGGEHFTGFLEQDTILPATGQMGIRGGRSLLQIYVSGFVESEPLRA